MRGEDEREYVELEGGSGLSIHDGWVLGYLYRSSADPDRRGLGAMAPARWRVRDGAAQILAEASDTQEALGASGWLMANTVPTAWSAPVLTSADGRVRRVPAPSVDPTRKGLRGEPIPVPVVGESAVWAREKGNELTVIANGSPEEKAPRPGIWRCQV